MRYSLNSKPVNSMKSGCNYKLLCFKMRRLVLIEELTFQPELRVGIETVVNRGFLVVKIMRERDW